jgi:hypothetical protein
MTDRRSVDALTRQEMIDRLEWNGGGYGFGVCAFAGMMSWALDEPGPNKPDLKSIVAVSGPPAKYTDEELTKLVTFAESKTARYDAMFRVRRGANLVLFDKREFDGKWMRKRLTWDMGPMYSDTLDDAIAVMERY